MEREWHRIASFSSLGSCATSPFRKREERWISLDAPKKRRTLAQASRLHLSWILLNDSSLPRAKEKRKRRCSARGRRIEKNPDLEAFNRAPDNNSRSLFGRPVTLQILSSKLAAATKRKRSIRPRLEERRIRTSSSARWISFSIFVLWSSEQEVSSRILSFGLVID